MISHLVLVYLLMTLSMLLFEMVVNRKNVKFSKSQILSFYQFSIMQNKIISAYICQIFD